MNAWQNHEPHNSSWGYRVHRLLHHYKNASPRRVLARPPARPLRSPPRSLPSPALVDKWVKRVDWRKEPADLALTVRQGVHLPREYRRGRRREMHDTAVVLKLKCGASLSFLTVLIWLAMSGRSLISLSPPCRWNNKEVKACVSAVNDSPPADDICVHAKQTKKCMKNT